MRILLTGATGYIGQRLLPSLLEQGHDVYCLVRDPRRFGVHKSYIDSDYFKGNFYVIKGDLLDPESLKDIPKEIDAAYYLVHSMALSSKDFQDLESKSAYNFLKAIEDTEIKQIIYLSGIANDKKLSRHLKSRLHVEEILRESRFSTTSLRAAIIIGSGSASFEIIRDLVEVLPVMVAPKWLNSRCQPIGIRDVLYYLTEVLGNDQCLNRSFDIGGPDVLSYKEMLLKYAEIRKLKRLILTVPVFTTHISSLWLYFITSTTFPLALSLAQSLHNEVICAENDIDKIIPRQCLSYEAAVTKAFAKIKQNSVVSSWRDAVVRGAMDHDFLDNAEVPTEGCVFDEVNMEFQLKDLERIKENVWSIGGERGWYCMNWAWALRGLADKVFGGIGLRKGRTHPSELRPGDAVDFWRVLLADHDYGRLVFYAEMKLPGEAWLELNVTEKDNGKANLHLKATFRPLGLLGRLYWNILIPVHWLMFNWTVFNIIKYRNKKLSK